MTKNKTNTDVEPVLQEMYNQAVNDGTFDKQTTAFDEMAQEAGTTVEALKNARAERNQAAAERFRELNPNSIILSNDSDNWRNNEERPGVE